MRFAHSPMQSRAPADLISENSRRGRTLTSSCRLLCRLHARPKTREDEASKKTGLKASNVRSPEAAMHDQGCKAKLPPGHVLACVTEHMLNPLTGAAWRVFFTVHEQIQESQRDEQRLLSTSVAVGA